MDSRYGTHVDRHEAPPAVYEEHLRVRAGGVENPASLRLPPLLK
jgi:hypothetical protein